MSEGWNILVVDDEPPIRAELRYLLEKDTRVGHIAEAGNVTEAVESILSNKPDVLFLDITMPGRSGIELAETLQNLKTPPVVVFVTAFAEYAEEGLEQLCAELRLLDPDYYRIVDLKNPKRVIHALEICYMTGKTYTSFRTQQKKERPFRILKIGLTRDREELYDRINRRVDQMMEEGLLDEVRSVLSYRHLNSLNTVGYKELFKYLDGEWELPFAIEKIKQNSRIYSRKQMTWFKRDEEIRWFHPEQETEILEYLRLQNLTHLPSLDTF